MKSSTASHISLFAVIVLCCIVTAGCRREAPKYRIGVSQCSSDDWRNQMNEEIERELMFHPDVEVEIRSAEDNNARQIADLEHFEREGCDLIIVSPNEAEALTPTISGIYRRGTPVLVFDRRVDGEDYTTFHGADNAGIGAQAAHYAMTLPVAHRNVLEIEGLLDSSPAQGRHRGFVDAAKELGIDILASAPGMWLKEEAARVADSLLDLYPNTTIIYAHNDRMAIGAAEVARRRGRDDIRVIGIDGAAPIGIRAVADSVIDATFLYPTAGGDVLRSAIDILDGKPYRREVIYPLSGAIDRTNADILLLQAQQLRRETQRLQRLKNSVDHYVSLHQAQRRLLIALLIIALLLIAMLSVLLRAYYTRKRMLALLEDKNRQIEQATQARLSFFTNVSHDLRTPLTLISAPMEALEEEASGRLTAGEQQMLEVARRNVGILRRLISDILDFRSADDGKLRLRRAPTNLATLVTHCVDNFATLARTRHVSLDCHVLDEGATSPVMDVDGEKLERVIFNLLSNAFKYVAGDGTGAIDVTLAVSARQARILVADNGTGIPGDKLVHIFERFYQADDGTSAAGGSGIGLSVAQYLVELHGGTIEAASAPGKGTTITITLPRRDADVKEAPEAPRPSILEAPAQPESAADARSEAPAKAAGDDAPLILVIDDNADIHTLMDGLLGADYRVAHAYDGAEGVQCASDEVPDAVICDVMMPGVDGMECCRRLKESVATSHIPVMMLTACAADRQRCEGLDNGDDAYMGKPFAPSVLRSQIASLLANRRRVARHLAQAATQAPPAPDDKNDDPKEAALSGLGAVDRAFCSRLHDYVQEHLAESDLDIDTLASEMGLGRSQFYRKVKALTGMSPVEMLAALRLETAARRLLRHPDDTVAEVAYATGFSSPAYFTKRFREAYGVTPTQYRTDNS